MERILKGCSYLFFFSALLGLRLAIGVRLKNVQDFRDLRVPCGSSPPWGDIASKHVAVLLRGETFRFDATENQSASWRELKDGDVPTMEGEFENSHQMVATRSQLENLIRPFKEEGFQVDVFSATYATSWHKLHMQEFGDDLQGDVEVRRSGSNQASNVLEGMKAVVNHAKSHNFWYEHVYILRHDMLLKQNMFELVKDKPDKILFPFIAFTQPCHRPDGTTYEPKHHVSDMMFFTPGKFFGCLNDLLAKHSVNIFNSDLNKNHVEIWDALDPLVGGDSHLGTLVDGEYWVNPRRYKNSTDTAVFENPIYDFPGREKTQYGAAHVGPMFEKLTGTKRSEVKPVAIDKSGTKEAMLIGFILTAVLASWYYFGSSGKMYSLLACGVYLIVSVSIDVSISFQKSKSGSYELNPMCAVCLVELLKLVVSIGLHSYNCWSSGDAIEFVPERLSMTDAKWISFPSMLYTLNNYLVWYAIGANDLATFGIFRDTMIFWTAAIWYCTFWVPLGNMRMLGLSLILAGVIVSEVAKIAAGIPVSWAACIVLGMTLSNAISSVANEKALKRNFGLDLNIQNSIMYSMMTVLSIGVLAVQEPRKLTSVAAFFHGFSSGTFLTICLQAGAGLLVSRLLKYADSTMKTVATCLRGPSLVILTTAPPMTIGSALIVASGCLVYLREGPLKVPEVDGLPEIKVVETPSSKTKLDNDDP